jgi:hypothetical protein
MCLGVLGLFDDGLELNTDVSSLSVIWNGDRTRQRIDGG